MQFCGAPHALQQLGQPGTVVEHVSYPDGRGAQANRTDQQTHRPGGQHSPEQPGGKPPGTAQAGSSPRPAWPVRQQPGGVIPMGLQPEGQQGQRGGQTRRHAQHPPALAGERPGQHAPFQGDGPAQRCQRRLGPGRIHHGAQQVAAAQAEPGRPGTGVPSRFADLGRDRTQGQVAGAGGGDGQAGGQAASPAEPLTDQRHGIARSGQQAAGQTAQDGSHQGSVPSHRPRTQQFCPAGLLLGPGGADYPQRPGQAREHRGESAGPPEDEASPVMKIECRAEQGQHRWVAGQVIEGQPGIGPRGDHGVVLGEGRRHEGCQDQDPQRPEQPIAAQHQPQRGTQTGEYAHGAPRSGHGGIVVAEEQILQRGRGDGDVGHLPVRQRRQHG